MPALLCQPQATPAPVQPTQPSHRCAATTVHGFFSTHLRPLSGLLAALCLIMVSPVQAQLKQTTNRVGIIMVSLPTGSFLMGSCKVDSYMEEKNKKRAFLGQPALSCSDSDNDPEARDNESPQHRVQVPAFQLGKTEVTLGQFKQFIDAEGRSGLVNDSFIQNNRSGDNAPVTMVSWNDAKDFIDWLSKTQGGGYRLPSEAEWEYACRAGTSHTYCGSNDAGSVAWHSGNSEDRPQAVATKKANAWGLHDMSGNVLEWVEDGYYGRYGFTDSHFGDAPADGSAWQPDYGNRVYTENGKQSNRVLRGGSWNAKASFSRARMREVSTSDNKFAHFGFRVARTVR